jgi:hypothetical protein
MLFVEAFIPGAEKYAFVAAGYNWHIFTFALVWLHRNVV